MSDVILRSDKDGLATLTLNRPDKLNSLTDEMFDLLNKHADDIAANTDKIGVVLLRGAGKAFCAGNDLGGISSREDNGAGASQFRNNVIEKFANLPQPVIAGVHGYCFTGALELALGADLIVVSEAARFGDTHGKFGLVPMWGMSARLPRRVGKSKALEMMFTSKTYTGAEAAAMGLANMCFPADTFEADLDALLKGILGNSWFSHRANKRLVLEGEDMSLRAALSNEVFRHGGIAPDAKELIGKFLKK